VRVTAKRSKLPGTLVVFSFENIPHSPDGDTTLTQCLLRFLPVQKSTLRSIIPSRGRPYTTTTTTARTLVNLVTV